MAYREYWECKVCCYGVSASYEPVAKIDKHYDETGHTMELEFTEDE